MWGRSLRESFFLGGHDDSQQVWGLGDPSYFKQLYWNLMFFWIRLSYFMEMTYKYFFDLYLSHKEKVFQICNGEGDAKCWVSPKATNIAQRLSNFRFIIEHSWHQLSLMMPALFPFPPDLSGGSCSGGWKALTSLFWGPWRYCSNVLDTRIYGKYKDLTGNYLPMDLCLLDTTTR